MADDVERNSAQFLVFGMMSRLEKRRRAVEFILLPLLLVIMQCKPDIVKTPCRIVGMKNEVVEFAVDTSNNISNQIELFCHLQMLSTEMCDTLHYLWYSRNKFTASRQTDAEASVCSARQVVLFCVLNSVNWDDCDRVYSRFMKDKQSADSGQCPHNLRIQHAENLTLDSLADDIASNISPTHDHLHIWTYWQTGPSTMNDMIKYVSTRNSEVSSKFGHTFHVLNELTVGTFLNTSIFHAAYELLSIVQKTDYMRMLLLHKYGGVWLDSDFIVYDDVNKLEKMLKAHHATVLLMEEFEGKIANSVIVALPQSPVMLKIIERLHATLDMYLTRRDKGLRYIFRDFIGPALLRAVVEEVGVVAYNPTLLNKLDKSSSCVTTLDCETSERAVEYKEKLDLNTGILVIPASFTQPNVNFACWHLEPLVNTQLWLLDSAATAQASAHAIRNSGMTVAGLWTLPSRRESTAYLDEVVLFDERSLFAHLLV